MTERSSLGRLWAPVTIVGIVVVALVWTWLGAPDSSEEIRQEQVTRFGAIVGLGAFALLLWGLLSRNISRTGKLRALGAALVALVAFFALFRYRGVSGDLVPQFELRFRESATNLADIELKALPGAGDFPQFLGPERDGRVSGVGLAREWTATSPRVVWRRPIGRGWSGFAVAGNSAVTHEQHGPEERVVAYELTTGKVLWASREVAHYENALAGEGPRATPSIDAGRVYAMGATGVLTAHELASGKLLWKRDVLKDSGGREPTWGKSNSPLVLDGAIVVVSAGGMGSSLVAYGAGEGDVRWRGGDDASAYASPVLVTLDGVRQIVSLNDASITGHDPRTGAVLWSQSWPSGQPTVAQPLPLPGDRLLVSAGYGVGSKLFRVGRDGSGTFRSELLWESVRLKSKFANLVLHEGFVYGLDDGILVCLDPETGRRAWKGGRYGHGQLLLVDDLLLVQGEAGELVLVAPSPEELRELARFRVLDAKIWNPPALAGRYLLVRNDAEAALVELPLAKGF